MLKRLVSSLVLAVGVALTAASCGFFVPQATELSYDPDNGVSANVGDLELRNITVLRSADTGDLGNVVFGAVNKSNQDIELTISLRATETSAATSSVTVTLKPGYTSFGNSDADQVLLSPGPTLGSLAKLFFVYGAETGDLVDVPVLDQGEWDFYAGFQPQVPVVEEPADDEGGADEAGEETPAA